MHTDFYYRSSGYTLDYSQHSQPHHTNLFWLPVLLVLKDIPQITFYTKYITHSKFNIPELKGQQPGWLSNPRWSKQHQWKHTRTLSVSSWQSITLTSLGQTRNLCSTNRRKSTGAHSKLTSKQRKQRAPSVNPRSAHICSHSSPPTQRHTIFMQFIPTFIYFLIQ